MPNTKPGVCRHFVTYSGVKLPLKLVNELGDEDLGNRNTYFRGYFDDQDRMLSCEKVVYDEVEMEHRYEYYDSGVLKRAEISEDGEDEFRVLCFDENGQPMPES